jgi:uncharacterized protein YhfF
MATAQDIGVYLSAKQIEVLRTGHLTTCSPKKQTDRIDPKLVLTRLNSIGKSFMVADKKGRPQLRAKLIDAFVTHYGDPDERLVAGTGFGDDTELCKSVYRQFWEQTFPSEPLTESTPLFVEFWEHFD